MPPPVNLQVIRTTAALEALAPEWLALWHADSHATPFSRPEWLLPWWRQFGQPDLRAVTVRQGDALVALIPLYIYEEPTSGERQLLLLGAGTSDYLDGIFAPACTPEHVVTALELLREENDWDVAHWTQLLPHSLLYQALQQLGPEIAKPYSGESCSRCPALPIAALPSKLRADVRYYRNAASGRGKLELIVTDEHSCLDMFENLVRLHTERWEKAGEPGVLSDPAVLRWHREALPQLQASGLLRLCALRAGEETLGVLYSLVDPVSRPSARAQRTQYFYLMGFTSELSNLRPGTLLTAFAIEHAASTGVTAIDMLRGAETYKKFWHVERIPTYGFAVRRDLLHARMPTARP
jgi:CelD/BcsL family acetyltransferase involved in cellulose biosynthesis